MGLLGTGVEKCKKPIVGVCSNVSLNIMGGAQNKVKIRPEFAASLHEEEFQLLENACKMLPNLFKSH